MEFGFLARLRLWQKFAILSVNAIILAGIPTFLFLNESGKTLQALEDEETGLPVISQTAKLVQFTQQHRGLSALYLNGNDAAQEQLKKKQGEIEAVYAALEPRLKESGDKDVVQMLAKGREEWQRLRDKVNGKALSGPESYAAHTALIPSLLSVVDLTGDAYGLSLDPDKDTYYLIQSIYYQLPPLTEELGKTRAFGTGLLSKKEASTEQRQLLSSFLARIQDREDQMARAFAKAAATNPDFVKSLTDPFRSAREASGQLRTLAKTNIIDAENLSYPAPDYQAGATRLIDTVYASAQTGNEVLTKTIHSKTEAARRMRWVLYLSLGGLAALAMLLSRMIARSVTQPIEHAIEIAQTVASGDLRTQVEVNSDNEIGQLMAALRDMNDKLRKVVGDVRESIDAVNAATHDIAHGNADMSSRLESQASSLEETASSMEELTSTVRQNAENAREANDLVASASDIAARGGNVVAQVVQTMGDINDSARKIVDIISVIDGIAFQTNILALNAAVEAARAGEQGRGFAVVAGEVRNLAQRSAGAAKEIKSLIQASVEKVGVGNQLADQAGSAMEDILHSVQRITSIMSEIATASAEQNAGIEQVNLAVVQMDEMTQRNAALIEETAAASASLEDQAEALVRTVGVFKVDDKPRLERRPAALRLGTS